MSLDKSRSMVPELVAILSVLLVLQFLVMPLLRWQDEQALQVNLLEKRYAKISELMMRGSDYVVQFDAVNLAYQAQRDRLFTVDDEATFKLQQQVDIENLLAKHNLVVSNFGWNPGIAHDDFDVFIYPAVVRVEGTTFGLMQAMLELESRSDSLLISDFEFRIQNQFPDSLGKVSGRMVLHFVGDYDSEQPL